MAIYIYLIILIFSYPLNANNTISISDSNFSVDIKRDEWGVPHIYGKKDADVSFGLAYAHSEDDYKTLEDIIFALRGELASIYGRDAAVNDYYVHLMNFWGLVDQKYETGGRLAETRVQTDRTHGDDRNVASVIPGAPRAGWIGISKSF